MDWVYLGSLVIVLPTTRPDDSRKNYNHYKIVGRFISYHEEWIESSFDNWMWFQNGYDDNNGESFAFPASNFGWMV